MKKILLFLLLVTAGNQIFAQLTAGLVAYWPMNGDFTDAGPNAINGTNFGATATTNPGGAANMAMSFANPTSTVAQYGTHPANANLNFTGTQDFSVDFSIYIPASLPHAEGIYDNNLNYGGYGFFMWNNSGFNQVLFLYKNGSIGTTSGALTGNSWYHITGVRSAGTLKIYINGVLNISASEGTTAPGYSFAARFGTMFFNGFAPPQYNGLVGKIDELRIYNRVLTIAEMGTLTTLPVKLSSFTAVKRKGGILLQWQSDYEQNSDYFNVQRSTDGRHFTTIATVKAKGNSSTINRYEYTDPQIILPGLNAKAVYYRLEAVDVDAHSSFSQINALAIDSRTIVLIYPNPVKNEAMLTINIAKKEDLQCKIIDNTGLVVKQLQWTLMPGSTALSIDVSSLAKGSYFMQLQSESVHEQKQFIKQ